MPLEEGNKIKEDLKEMREKVPNLRGIRRMLQPDDPYTSSIIDFEWFNKYKFHEGLNLLAENDLSFDLLTRSTLQHKPVLELLSKTDDNLSIIVNHCGGRNIIDK